MSRPRVKRNKDLPANLYRNGVNTWKYRHPITGAWHGMGANKSKAIAAARKLNDILIPATDLVSVVMGEVTFGEFSKKFLSEKRRKDGRVLAPNSIKTYTHSLNRCAEWDDNPLSSITLFMTNKLLESLPASTSIETRSLLVQIFDLAISKGLVTENPAAQTIKRFRIKQRKRHTLEGLAKIRDASPQWLQNAIDLAMLTTQRRIDIIQMKWSDIRDGYLHVAQEKTTDDPEDDFELLEGAGYVRIKINNELQKVLDRCKDNVISPFIIHRVPKGKTKNKGQTKEHWTQLEAPYVSHEFLKAVKQSGAYSELSGRQLPSFHEIRALSIHLHKKAGKSAQTLAGHATEKMTEMYASGHEIIWNDADIGINLPFKDK
ncbi:phage integrase Arm DNA-binding domain-containing protein [Acinetobacter entericus]|uniref:Phage integrase Arm DNA-binding domain-containing protein n=1 Tax=Acinetobacter entericus TaxID=2989714 RepID=A0ABT3NKF2_9GAMM|nr:phage integrase Arm DNA-binding domain-containing protein [Acinetobacter entericus]MCW8040047.1 phage integrase Arm DNA-binding domain-containing protein [Acinetobacter entericus]